MNDEYAITPGDTSRDVQLGERVHVVLGPVSSLHRQYLEHYLATVRRPGHFLSALPVELESAVLTVPAQPGEPQVFLLREGRLDETRERASLAAALRTLTRPELPEWPGTL